MEVRLKCLLELKENDRAVADVVVSEPFGERNDVQIELSWPTNGKRVATIQIGRADLAKALRVFE